MRGALFVRPFVVTLGTAQHETVKNHQTSYQSGDSVAR